jgi:hypothetical protein
MSLEGDIWIPRLRLGFEFVITILVLIGAGVIALHQDTSAMADSGASAVASLVIGYWFGRVKQ